MTMLKDNSTSLIRIGYNEFNFSSIFVYEVFLILGGLPLLGSGLHLESFFLFGNTKNINPVLCFRHSGAIK